MCSHYNDISVTYYEVFSSGPAAFDTPVSVFEAERLVGIKRIGGLTPNLTYHFQVLVENDDFQSSISRTGQVMLTQGKKSICFYYALLLLPTHPYPYAAQNVLEERLGP